jgi:hypothetical protein
MVNSCKTSFLRSWRSVFKKSKGVTHMNSCIDSGIQVCDPHSFAVPGISDQFSVGVFSILLTERHTGGNQ